MIKFSVKLFMALLPLIVFACIFIAYEPYYYFGINDNRTSYLATPLARVREFMRNPSENIILGDSRMNYFDINYVESLTGKRYAILSTGGQAPNQSNQLYEWAQDKLPTKNLFMDVSFYQIRKNNSGDSLNSVFYMAEHPLIYMTTRDYVVETFGLFLKKLSPPKQAENEVISNTKETEYEIIRKDLVDYASIIYNECRDYSIGHDHMGNITSILRKAQSNDVNVLLVAPPVHESIWQNVIEPLGLKDDIIEYKDILSSYATIYDMEYLNEFTNRQENFSDGFHFSTDALKKFTDAIFMGRANFMKIYEPSSTAEIFEKVKTKELPGLELTPEATLEDSIISYQIAKMYEENHLLLSNDLSVFERTNITRDWVFEKILWGKGSDVITNIYDNRLFSNSPQIMASNCLNLKDTYAGGFLCGGISYSLACLYRSLGYDAFTLDMAIMDIEGNVKTSHVVTLINIGDSKNKKWIVQDATYNITYTGKDGKPLSYFEIVDLLKQNRYSEVVALSGNNFWRRTVSTNHPSKNVSSYLTSNEDIIYEKNHGVYLYKHHMTIDNFWESSPEEVQLVLKRDGIQDDPKSFFLYPYGLYNVDVDNADMVELQPKIFKQIVDAVS